MATGLAVTAGQIAAGDVTAPLQGLLAGAIHKNIRERGNSFLVSMADRARRTDDQIATSIRKFVKGAGDVRRIAIGHGGGTEAERALGKQRGEDALKAARRVTAALMAGPQHESAAADEFAPETGRAVNATTKRVYSFLQNKIPPPLVAPKSPLYSPLRPHPSEIEKFARYYEAATKPLAVLDKMQAGQLSPEHIEAIKKCWPKLFEQIQSRVTTELMGVDSVPYAKKVQLGALLGIPTHQSLEVDSIRRAQEALTAQTQAPQPPPNVPPAKPIAKSFQGEAERLESQEIAI
jgi:hypothetical protein